MTESLLPTVHSSLLAARTQIDNAIAAIEDSADIPPGPGDAYEHVVAALIEVDGCFNAAFAEGWLDALAAGDVERIRDIWDRRLSQATAKFPAAIAKAEGRT